MDASIMATIAMAGVALLGVLGAMQTKAAGKLVDVLERLGSVVKHMDGRLLAVEERLARLEQKEGADGR